MEKAVGYCVYGVESLGLYGHEKDSLLSKLPEIPMTLSTDSERNQTVFGAVGFIRCRECDQIVKPTAVSFSNDGDPECPNCARHE